MDMDEKEKPKKKQISIRLPVDMLAQIDAMAKQEVRDRSNMIEWLCSKAIQGEIKEGGRDECEKA